jgi:CheY-like chemotaxis protein
MTHRLLFIDDIDSDGEIACWYLQRAGIRVDYEVVGAEPALIVSLAQHTPQLILADIVLPDWDVWEAQGACRRLAPGVPFAIHSGAVSVADAERAASRGVLAVVDKDEPAELIALVRRVLGIP